MWTGLLVQHFILYYKSDIAHHIHTEYHPIPKVAKNRLFFLQKPSSWYEGVTSQLSRQIDGEANSKKWPSGTIFSYIQHYLCVHPSIHPTLLSEVILQTYWRHSQPELKDKPKA